MCDLIGLCGYAGSGKDELAKILTTDCGFQRRAFADVLKEFVYELNPLVPPGYHIRPLIDRDGWDLAKSRPAVRRLLQDVGLAARNTIGSDVWVTAALTDLPRRTVLTDCRFRNEVAAVRERGGQVWLVQRPGTGPANDHPSEILPLTEPEFDRIVVNDGTIRDLREKVLCP